MDPPGAMGGFDFKIIKDDDSPYLDVRKDENSGYLFITGGERGGKAVVRVFSTLRPSVYTDIDVYVRHRVVLIIDASFSRWYSNFLNESLKFRSGACDDLSATLAWWSGDLDTQGDRVDLDNIKFTQCSAHEVFSPYFYYECDKYGINSGDLRNGQSPTKTDEGGFLAGSPLCFASRVNDLPLLYLGDGKNAPESQRFYEGVEGNPSCID